MGKTYFKHIITKELTEFHLLPPEQQQELIQAQKMNPRKIKTSLACNPSPCYMRPINFDLLWRFDPVLGESIINPFGQDISLFQHPFKKSIIAVSFIHGQSWDTRLNDERSIISVPKIQPVWNGKRMVFAFQIPNMF